MRVKDLYNGGVYDIVHAMLPVWRCDVYQPHAGLANDLLATGHMKHTRRVVQRLSRVANHINPKRVGLAQIERQLMKHEPWVMCFSSMMKDYARSHFALPEEHMVMLMNGIDLSKFDPAMGAKSRTAIREEWKVEPEHRLGLLVGHNWKLKGVQDAIDALYLLKQHGESRVVLMVVGRDDARSYRKMADKMGVGDRVIFVGSVGDPRPLYGAADFLLLPTRRDTCSLVVLEALAMGLPVITTRQNGASEVIEAGRQGIVLDRGDTGALADAMGTMADGVRRREMSREALAMRGRLSFDYHVGVVEGGLLSSQPKAGRADKCCCEREGHRDQNAPACPLCALAVFEDQIGAGPAQQASSSSRSRSTSRASSRRANTDASCEARRCMLGNCELFPLGRQRRDDVVQAFKTLLETRVLGQSRLQHGEMLAQYSVPQQTGAPHIGPAGIDQGRLPIRLEEREAEFQSERDHVPESWIAAAIHQRP